MKPPNIKAPKCTLFSIQCFIFQGQGPKGSTVLPRLIASIVGGSLLLRAHFESWRAAEAKNAATINHLMSKHQRFYFIFQGQRSQGLTGLATAPSEHRDGQLTSESPFRIVEILWPSSAISFKLRFQASCKLCFKLCSKFRFFKLRFQASL